MSILKLNNVDFMGYNSCFRHWRSCYSPLKRWVAVCVACAYTTVRVKPWVVCGDVLEHITYILSWRLFMLQSSPNNTNRRAGSERVPVAHSHRNRICIFVGLRATLFLFGEESDIARQLYFSRPFDKSNGTYSHRYNTFGLFLWAGRWRNVWRGRCAGRGEVMRGGWRGKGMTEGRVAGRRDGRRG